MTNYGVMCVLTLVTANMAKSWAERIAMVKAHNAEAAAKKRKPFQVKRSHDWVKMGDSTAVKCSACGALGGVAFGADGSIAPPSNVCAVRSARG